MIKWPQRQSGKRSKCAEFQTWLGHWKPEYDCMNQIELMLQARLHACPPARSPALVRQQQVQHLII